MEPQKIIVVTPLELKAIVADAVSSALNARAASPPAADPEEWGGVALAQEVLGLAESTIYSNIHRIPHQKRHGRLYFNRHQLNEYLAGRWVAVPKEFEQDAIRLARSRQKRRGEKAQSGVKARNRS